MERSVPDDHDAVGQCQSATYTIELRFVLTLVPRCLVF